MGPTYTYYLWTTGPYGPECVLRSQCLSWYESFWCTKTDVVSSHVNWYDYSWQFINQVRGTAPTWTTQWCTWWTTFPDAASATSFCTNWNYHIISKCCKIN